MSNFSNNQGRAYEYICLLSLQKEIATKRPAQIIENSSLEAAKNAWNTLSADEKITYERSANAAVSTIFALEPLIVEDGDDMLELFIQPDQAGQDGDVRDILIIRRDIQWEIGLSIKHNHFAVKHSRLSGTIDFGNSWFGVPCSQTYWDAVTPVFSFLNEEKKKGTKFSELDDKENDVYVPILQAFIDEINSQYIEHKDIPTKMVEYLLSKFDFYKVISVDRHCLTQIQSFNTHGTLNQASRSQQPSIHVPLVTLPTRIVRLDFVPDKKNTVELYMDGGWQFTFRIHNAATLVEPSLKFDIQIVGMPTAIITIDCYWK
jgi:hypothetical protein